MNTPQRSFAEHHYRVPTRHLVLRPENTPRSLVVGLHGMGHDAQRLEADIAPTLGTDRLLLLPDAPLPFEQRAEDGSRSQGHAWYVFTGDQEAFLDQARRTSDWLRELIAKVRQEHDAEGLPLVIFGYSQGGYLAGIHALLDPSGMSALITANSRLKERLARELEKRDSGEVIIAPDSDVKLDRVVNIFDIVKEAGATNIALLDKEQ